MRPKKIKNRVIKILTLTVMAMIFPDGTFATEISFEGPVSYKRNHEAEFKDAKAGDKIRLESSEALFVTRKDSLPILVYSVCRESATLSITNADLNSATEAALRVPVEKASTEIVTALRKADTLIKKRSYAQALQIVTPLKEKYPRIASVLFMSATLRYLSGDKISAIEDLEKGLLLEPNDEDARAMLLKLRRNS